MEKYAKDKSENSHESQEDKFILELIDLNEGMDLTKPDDRE